jgi:DNA-binding transcriptional LysR family regulator
MEIRKLRHASILAQELSFSKAAEKLNLSQSALSKSIASLESNLGLALFERLPAGVALTQAGKEFILGANKLLQQANALHYDMSLLKDGYRGNIVFGMGSLPAAAYEEPVLLELMKYHPDISVQVEVSTPADLLDHLINDRIEFFVGDTRTLPIPHEYTVETLLTLEVEFIVRPGHPLLKSKGVNLKNIYQYPLVGAPVEKKQLDAVHMDHWLDMQSTNDFAMHLSSENISALKSVVSQTDAIMIAPFGAVAEEIQSKQLIALDVKEKPKSSLVNLDLVQSAIRQQSASAKVVIDLIERTATGIENKSALLKSND